MSERNAEDAQGPLTFMWIGVLPRSWKCRVGWHTGSEMIAQDVLRHPQIERLCHRCNTRWTLMCVDDSGRRCAVCLGPAITPTQAETLLGYDLGEAIEEYKRENPWRFPVEAGGTNP